MEEWKEYRVAEVIEDISMGPFGSNIKRDNYVDSGVPYLNGSNLSSYKLNENSFYYVTEEKAKSLGRCVAKRGDIIVTHRGTIGQMSYIPFDSKYEHYLTGNSQFRLTVNKKVIRPDFFVYYFHTRMGQHRLLANASQVGVPALARPTSTFKEVLVPVPKMEVQNQIMDILHSLDDKIEVNRRINDNLEQQAQALFKSWFVDFEPFKDQPFVESELGMIPQGWKVVYFKDFITPTTEKVPVGSLPEYSVTNNGIIPRDAKFNKKLSKETSKNKVLRKDNLVFGMSREILNWGIMEDEIGGVSSAYNVYKIDKGIIDPVYLRLYMKARISDFNSLIGTAAREGQSLDKGALMQKTVYVPSTKIIGEFFRLYFSIVALQKEAENESRRLAELRDTLLPRLMSGELKVNDVDA